MLNAANACARERLRHALAVGYTITAVFVGRSAVQVLRLSAQHPTWYLLEGLALFGLLGFVPLIGTLLVLLAVTFGLGTLALALVDAYRGRPAAAPQAVVHSARANAALIPATSTPS